MDVHPISTLPPPSEINEVAITRSQDNFLQAMACLLHGFQLLRIQQIDPMNHTQTYLAHRVGAEILKPVIICFLDELGDEAQVYIEDERFHVVGNLQTLFAARSVLIDGKCTFSVNGVNVEVFVLPARYSDFNQQN